MFTADTIYLYTDGSSLGNPGPGGWGAVLLQYEHRKELAAGFRKTTNNRMEIMAVLRGLEALHTPSDVIVYTDSRYVCDAVEKRWLLGWCKNGWKTTAKKPVKNQDLWETLIPLLQRHTVRFKWIKGHAGHPENERCDQLAKAAASAPEYIDTPYEAGTCG